MNRLNLVNKLGLTTRFTKSSLRCNSKNSKYFQFSFFLSLLRGLAGFDALFLLMALFSFGLPTLSPWFERNFFMRYMALSFGLIHTFRVGSVYTTLAVTFERFQVIVFPLKQMR